MDPLILLIEPDLDERAAAATMSRAQRVYEEGARDISRVMREQLTEGTQAAGKGFDELETKARKAYLGMQDAGEKVASAERKHEAAKERGAANAEALGRRVERARLDEIQAIERATASYREYENAAQGAGRAGESAGQSIIGGLRDSISGAGQPGGDMANEFAAGFAGSSALMRLGAAGGPIGLALAGVAAIGVTAGKVLADNIAAGLQSLQTQDLFQARLGVDDATMAQYGKSAAKSYTDMWGTSPEDNLRAVQFSVQGGVIGPDASDAEIQNTIAQMHTLASVMEVDVQEAARAAGQLMRGGFAQSGTEAADIIATGFQQGLDISGDWLDTITEYTTQFRKLGLDGNDAIGLISQGLQGGARDSDKVADSLKEFSIRAVDGSKSTAEGFGAIGFKADEMAQKILAGGDSARGAFSATLQAIKSLEDPQQQALAWVDLFGTQWEDMGDAINSMDLSTARAEFGTTAGTIDAATQKLSEHTNGWDALGRQFDVTFGKLQKWLADTDIGKFFSQGLPSFIGETFLPGDPRAEAEKQLAAAKQAEAERRAMGSGFANAGEAQRARRGITPGADGLTPGVRTPILTETQRAAQEEAEGGGSKSLPDAPQLPLQYTATAGLPTQIANATTRLDEARHEVAEKEARVNQLRQSNLADENDIQKAENDLTKAGQDQLQAERALNDARISATEKQTKQIAGLSSELGEFGAQLDKDFGISKGLGGIMENVTRFLGNLIAAPFLQALGMVAKANPNEGSGMTGILAANGAFGQQYTPAALAAAQSSAGAPGYGSGTPGVSAQYGTPGAAQPGQSARDFAHSTMMPFWQNQGLTVGDHQADQYGEHQNGALDIMVDSIAEGNAVLQQVLQDPNVYGAIFNNQAFGYGQGASPRPYSGGNTGNPTQDHQDHVHALYKPGGSNNIASGGPSISIPAAAPYAPGAAGAGPGWFPPAQTALAGVNGGGGQSPVFGAGPASPMGPSIGGGVGFPMPGAPGAGSAAGLGGQPYPAGPKGGGLGMSGGLMDAAMMGTSAMDMMMPGAGAAAKIGIQLANRTIKYAGQMAGIGVSGLMQTFTPAGDNPKASIGNSWFGKIAGGLAGAAPALPNQAGGKPPGALAGQQDGQQGQGGTGGNTINNTVHLTNNRATEDMVGNQIVREQSAMHSQPGKQ